MMNTLKKASGQETSRMKKEGMALSEDLRGRIRDLETRWPLPPDEKLPCEDPVFVLSAGWRSGSTLLQRMLMADGSTLVWGEPFAHSGIIQKMSDQFSAFTSSWPNANHVGLVTGERDADRWIANLSPPADALRNSHRLFFDRLFGEPARKSGKRRWGVKEVRLSTHHAAYLRWLFPEARFLFLVRDPLQSFASYRQRGPWFFEWPRMPIGTARQFARLWNTMALDFHDHHEALKGLLIRYEDLESRWKEVGDYADLDVPRPSELAIIKGNAEIRRAGDPGLLERWAIRSGTRKTGKLYGYA